MARGTSFWNPPPGQLEPIEDPWATVGAGAAQAMAQNPWATVGAGAGQAMSQTPFGGWNAQNIFDEDYWNQVNEQAKTGAFTESRDDIANARDAFLKPYEQRFHELAAAQGAQAEGSTGLLAQDPRFRAFVQQGTMPTFQTPTQQWNAAPAAAAAAPPAATPAAGDTSKADALWEELMARSKQGLNVDRNDPTIRAQVDPFVAQQTRASRNYLSDLAEREGGAPVNLRGEQRMAGERLGATAGAFEGEIIGREIGARRDEIAQALQQRGAILSQGQREALERELAALNDRARTADRSAEMERFLKELALREWDLGQGWDARWAGV